ncbi:MAG TPA: DUF4252 domain-containing protein [Candidatus Angelobacter sp.]|jgi:hypothetical protein
MNRITKMLARTLVGLVMCFSALRGYGQDAKLQLDNLNKLSDKAARVTDVTLDGSLLQFAKSLIEKVGDDDKDVEQLRSIIGNLKGIYIKSFEFDEASQYSKADVEAVRSQLSAPRWTKIVQSTDKRLNEHDEIYLLKDHERIAGLVILVAEARELTVVNIVGEVPVDKIASLERHIVVHEQNQGGKTKQKKASHDEE